MSLCVYGVIGKCSRYSVYGSGRVHVLCKDPDTTLSCVLLCIWVSSGVWIISELCIDGGGRVVSQRVSARDREVLSSNGLSESKGA